MLSDTGRIVLVCARLGITRAEVAEEIGMTEAALSKLLKKPLSEENARMIMGAISDIALCDAWEIE